jgi:hypothetical protein
MHIIKQTFTNFYAEHRTLCLIVFWAFALPISLAIVGAIFALLLMIFSLLLGQFFGGITLILMIIGGVVGYFVSTIK